MRRQQSIIAIDPYAHARRQREGLHGFAGPEVGHMRRELDCEAVAGPLACDLGGAPPGTQHRATDGVIVAHDLDLVGKYLGRPILARLPGIVAVHPYMQVGPERYRLHRRSISEIQRVCGELDDELIAVHQALEVKRARSRLDHRSVNRVLMHQQTDVVGDHGRGARMRRGRSGGHGQPRGCSSRPAASTRGRPSCPRHRSCSA